MRRRWAVLLAAILFAAGAPAAFHCMHPVHVTLERADLLTFAAAQPQPGVLAEHDDEHSSCGYAGVSTRVIPHPVSAVAGSTATVAALAPSTFDGPRVPRSVSRPPLLHQLCVWRI
jgi:hypothetical protein